MSATGVWSPCSAAIPASWVKDAVQEFVFTMSRVTCSARGGGITP
jgi:hypothetical protein